MPSAADEMIDDADGTDELLEDELEVPVGVVVVVVVLPVDEIGVDMVCL
jgi:hypothetical protein